MSLLEKLFGGGSGSDAGREDIKLLEVHTTDEETHTFEYPEFVMKDELGDLHVIDRNGRKTVFIGENMTAYEYREMKKPGKGEQ